MKKFPIRATMNTYATSARFCAYADRSCNIWILSSNDTSQKDVTGLNQSNKEGTSVCLESDFNPQSRVVYRVVKLREDSLQPRRPKPAVQQQARPLRVTTACIHI